MFNKTNEDNNIEDIVERRHSDDIEDIISETPSYLLNSGITLICCLMVLIIGLSIYIKYPDIINAQLTITSSNSAKAIIANSSGRISQLLIKENQNVIAGEPLAFIESTADHKEVLGIIDVLHKLQTELATGNELSNPKLNFNTGNKLGELQVFYQTFNDNYLRYKSVVGEGLQIRKEKLLQENILNINEQKLQLFRQKELQQHDFELAAKEFDMHKKLLEEKVETPAEFRQAESRYLAKQAPLLQTEASIINLNNNYFDKKKDRIELANQIDEEKAKFQAALNSLISQAEEWKKKYILTASQNGKVSFVGIIQNNQPINLGQEIFTIIPNKSVFYGEIQIQQLNMGKVKVGQNVLIKLNSYPFEEYGLLNGVISTIDDVPSQDHSFLAKVTFNNYKNNIMATVTLKQGMTGYAEVITKDATIWERLTRNFRRIISKN